ncbi:MAG: peptidylprolyl isomerase, partial [Verrucomicrobiota bacterium]
AFVSEVECRNFYEQHRNLFQQPVRFRASHLFLAAHVETPPDVVAEKEDAITALAARMAKGEIFSELVAQNSEDEATKSRAGDLNYFSELRVASEFFAEVAKLLPGQMSKAFQSHLGFHLIQLTETKPARLLSYEEARPEIALALANARRASIMQRISSEMAQPANELRDCVSARLP